MLHKFPKLRIKIIAQLRIILSTNLNLKLNPYKCNEVRIQLRNKISDTLKEQLTINNVVVPRVEHVKYIGLIISNDLSWSKHVSNIISKI